MPARLTARSSFALVLLAAIACGGSSDDVGTGPSTTSLDLGQGTTLGAGRTLQVKGGATASEYYAVVVNTSLTAGQSESFTFRGDGVVPASSLIAADAPVMARQASDEPGALVRDEAFESRLRDRERAALPARMAAARGWFAGRSVPVFAGGSATRVLAPGAPSTSAIPANAQVGDLVSINVNGKGDPCKDPIIHAARVVAVTAHAVVLADTLNPQPTFSSADYQRFAARFDTLVYPLDVGAFGTPTDIDGNGRIGLLFTRAVNELTDPGSTSYVGGFAFSRDLFPVVTAGRLTGCPSSNQSELFYLLAPDPLGTVNNNRRSIGFVDSATTSVIAHEFEHLINASRRLYVNTSAAFPEATWLDEGLAHIAEELLFYREAGLTPRLNLASADIPSGSQRATAFNMDMLANAGRYRSFLVAPARNSPYANGDSLPTRGATWSLLRYSADRLATSDGDIWFRLVNSTATGVTNFEGTLGVSLSAYVRDWSASNAADDVAPTGPEYQQKSWNWHSLYQRLNGGVFPLQIPNLANGSTASGTIVAGGSSYYKLGVPASGTATLALTGATSSNLQLVLVRTK